MSFNNFIDLSGFLAKKEYHLIFPLETMQKILSFSKLPKGWHYGEGGPFDRKAIDAGFTALTKLSKLGFGDTDAFPGAHGEIMVTGYEGDHYVEIILETDGTWSLNYEYKGVEKFAEYRMSPEKACIQLEAIAETMFAEGIWNTSDFSIPTILTADLSKTVSRAWLSGTLRKEEDVPSSNWLALTQAENQYVNTLENITLPRLGENRLFFGSLKKTSSLPAIA